MGRGRGRGKERGTGSGSGNRCCTNAAVAAAGKLCHTVLGQLVLN